MPSRSSTPDICSITLAKQGIPAAARAYPTRRPVPAPSQNKEIVKAYAFIPPSQKEITPSALTHWMENCALVINQVAHAAKGGTLVLMTGYDRLDLLSNAFHASWAPEDLSRVLIQRRTAGTSVMADEFLRLAQQGKRPIWLATGGAWTGLDLSDPQVGSDIESAQEDLVLTDLVIPALPFCLERSSTQLSRMRRMSFMAEIISTQRKLRQGLGRLVRREGLLHRNIWLLDGRLVNPAAASYTADLRRVLQPYLKHKRIN